MVSASLASTGLARQTRPPASPAGRRCPGPHPDSALPRPAFYTTAVFKLERLILRLLVSFPSTDAEARQLAQGKRDSFAAWSVEARATNQLLLSDFRGRTKSWLMVASPGAGAPGTRLYFGSAVVPVRSAGTGRASLGFVFTALLGFHKLYSRILLKSAMSQLSRQ